LPPPAGGISIHLWRLKHLLASDFELDFIDEASEKKAEFLNMRSLNIGGYLQKVKKADLIFVHSGNRLFKKIHVLVGKALGKKIIITIHGYGNRRSFFFRKLDEHIYGLADRIILVNNEIQHKLKLPQQKCVVRNAFLPPIMSEEPELPAQLQLRIEQARKKNKLIVCANASRLDTFNNQDLYGLDISLQLAKMLKDNNRIVEFIFTVSSLQIGADRFEKAKQYIIDNALQDVFFLIQTKLSFAKLIEASDIVIRPTNTDGDALTIREGLYLNKFVLASNVVQRPERTITFETRNVQDAYQKILSIIASIQLKENKNNIQTSAKDYGSFYTQLITATLHD
jgi:hypothetical protein